MQLGATSDGEMLQTISDCEYDGNPEFNYTFCCERFEPTTSSELLHALSLVCKLEYYRNLN
jgi:hypothetical protein